MNAFYVPALAGHDLRHAGDGVAAARGDEPARRLRGLLGQLQRRRLLGHALQLPRPASRPTSTSGSPRRGSTASRRSAAPIPRARRAERERARRRSFGDVDPDLFRRIVNRCVEEGRLCIDQMMALDAQGGTGLAGTINTHPGRGPAGERASATRPSTSPEFCTPAESMRAVRRRDACRCSTPPPAPGGAPPRPTKPSEPRSTPMATESLAPAETSFLLRPPDLGGAAAARADPGRDLHRRRARRHRASSRRSPSSGSGAISGTSGSPASTTRGSASCTWCSASSCCCAASPTR